MSEGKFVEGGIISMILAVSAAAVVLVYVFSPAYISDTVHELIAAASENF